MTLFSMAMAALAEPAGNASCKFSEAELSQCERDGYVIARGLTPDAMRRRMLEVTLDGVARLVDPIEYEADLHYPGAPPSKDAAGGRTVRRLKQAHARDYVFTEWLTHAPLVGRLRQLLGTDLVCPLAHHNCVMSKEPRFSSDTGWHQDIRYWSFERPELVTVWLALGRERKENGCLQVIPGSHRMTFDAARFDADVFFRDDPAENRALIDRAVHVELEPGDVLFFHCRTLHSATRNHTPQTKYSVVFTFRAADNPPVAGTRSGTAPEIVIR